MCDEMRKREVAEEVSSTVILASAQTMEVPMDGILRKALWAYLPRGCGGLGLVPLEDEDLGYDGKLNMFSDCSLPKLAMRVKHVGRCLDDNAREI